MPNTIELLEVIGSDASLRHASAQDLARALDGMHASEALRQAAATGDSAWLAAELGHRNMTPLNNPVQTGFEEESEDGGADDAGDLDETPDPPDPATQKRRQS